MVNQYTGKSNFTQARAALATKLNSAWREQLIEKALIREINRMERSYLITARQGNLRFSYVQKLPVAERFTTSLFSQKVQAYARLHELKTEAFNKYGVDTFRYSNHMTI